jgi:queuosine precursor transporter
MINELIFVSHAALISFAAAIGARLGKEALVSLVCIQAILSNIFVSKQMVLFGLYATCSDAFSVGSSLCLNLLQEKFGKEIASKAIWISLFTLIFYLAMSQIHLIYVPSEVDFTQGHYQVLLSQMPRIIIASLIAYFISQQTDRFLYSFVNEKLKWKNFILKNYSSLLVSQFIDTVLFSFLGLYGNVENVWHIIILSYVIKVVTIAIITPLTKLTLPTMN